VLEVSGAFIIRVLLMEAARISETSVDIQSRTRQYIAEDSELQLGSHLAYDDLHNFNVKINCFDEVIDIFADKTRKIDLKYGVRHNLL
jgi:hypothetical protein